MDSWISPSVSDPEYILYCFGGEDLDLWPFSCFLRLLSAWPSKRTTAAWPWIGFGKGRPTCQYWLPEDEKHNAFGTSATTPVAFSSATLVTSGCLKQRPTDATLALFLLWKWNHERRQWPAKLSKTPPLLYLENGEEAMEVAVAVQIVVCHEMTTFFFYVFGYENSAFFLSFLYGLIDCTD